MTAEEVAYRARALAQAHPMTPLAKRFMDLAVAEQKTSQPIPELGMWAGAALLNAYCVRLVHESEAGMELVPTPGEVDDSRIGPLDAAATRIAGELRSDDIDRHMVVDTDSTVEALDRIVASEVSRRLDNWKDELDRSAWSELEDYLTWWVIKGYALRIAEGEVGALAAASPSPPAP